MAERDPEILAAITEAMAQGVADVMSPEQPDESDWTVGDIRRTVAEAVYDRVVPRIAQFGTEKIQRVVEQLTAASKPPSLAPVTQGVLQHREPWGMARQGTGGVIEARYLAWYAARGLLWLWRTPGGEQYHVVTLPVSADVLVAFTCLTKAPDSGTLTKIESLAPEVLSIRLCPVCADVVASQLRLQEKPLRRPGTTDIPEQVGWHEVLDEVGESRLLSIGHAELPRVLHIAYDWLSHSGDGDGTATDCGLADHQQGREYPVMTDDQRIESLNLGVGDEIPQGSVFVCTRCIATLRGMR